MPRPARPALLLGVVLALTACDKPQDSANRRIDDLTLRLGELEQRVESVIEGEAMMPDLTPQDIPRLERDLGAQRKRLGTAEAVLREAAAQLLAHQDATPVHELDTIRAQLSATLEQASLLETELVGLADRLQRDEQRRQDRDWEPTADELLAAENTQQVIRLDTSMRELLLAVEQERMTEDEANPELRYFMNQREVEMARQARLAFDARLSASWERVNQLETQIAALKDRAQTQGATLAVLEAERADGDLLLAAHASARADAEDARRAVQRVETLIERANQGGK